MTSIQTSIQSKLMRVILITSGVVLLLSFTSFFIYEYVSYRQITKRQLALFSKIIAQNSTAALAFDHTEDGMEVLSGLKVEPTITAACIFDKDGKVFAFYPITLSLKSFPSASGLSGYHFDSGFLEGYETIKQNDKVLGTLFIRKDISEMYDRFQRYGIIGGGIMIVTFLLGYFLSRNLQRKISIPIVSLAVTAKAISQNHDYSVRATKLSNDELGLLTDGFNQMLAQIERQNQEIVSARTELQGYAEGLEKKVKERTDAVKRQADLIQAVFESSVDIIAVYDAQTRLMAMNGRYEEQFGVVRNSAIGKTLLELFPQAKNAHAQLMHALTGETIHNVKYQSVVDKEFYESFVIPMRNEKKEVYAVLVIAHNISESVKFSDQLKESALQLKILNESLIRKNNELEQFAYIASHDLQEPLRKIQTFIELASKNQGDEQVVNRYMEKVQTSAARMSTLIRDVLDYSRLTQGSTSLEAVDLNKVLENVKTDFELMIEQKNAVLSVQSLPIISGNAPQLHQLFANLISNSLKFTKVDPVISIECRHFKGSDFPLDLYLEGDTTYAQIIVKDNGIGFDQQYADKIFTIFQRLNTREKFEGTGIGLALCKKIVENHKGHICAKSAVNQGTSFFIYLPLEKGI